MIFTMMMAFAELEVNLLSERTKKGLEATKIRVWKGYRLSLPNHKKRDIKFLYDKQELTGEEVLKSIGISHSTVYQTMKENKWKRRFIKWVH